MVDYYELNGYNGSNSQAYYDEDDDVVYRIQGYTAAIADTNSSIVRQIYFGTEAFTDLDGRFEGVHATFPFVPVNPGTYTYYDGTLEDWYFIVTRFMSSWRHAGTHQDVLSGRTWLPETDDAGIALDFQDNGFDGLISYAYYDDTADTLYDIAGFVPEIPVGSETAYIQTGGTFRLGPETNIFTGTNRAAATTSRNTYATANPSWLTIYNENLTFFIRLEYGTNVTYEARNAAGNGWEDVSNIVEGDDGPQGQFVRSIHANFTAGPSTAPIGGSMNLNTGILTPPAGSTIDPSAPGVGEDVYISQAHFDPANQSGTVTPTWSIWVERQHLSAGLSHVEVVSGDLTGTGVAADPIGLDDARKFEANPTAAITDALLKVNLGGTVYNVDEIIDVTSVGLPTINEANHRSLFIDFDTPRVWVGHRTPISAASGSANSNTFADADYLGEFASRPTPTPASVSVFYYDTTLHYFELGTRIGGQLQWQHASISAILGGTVSWLGEQDNSDVAANLITNFDSNTRYLYFSNTSLSVRELTNSTYTAPVSPGNQYTAEPISTPTGVSGITGVSVSNGLVGGGTSGVVTITIDETATDFPIIPIDKGGTGEILAIAALASLGGTTLSDALDAVIAGTNIGH